jgi:hypothetical protein
MKKRNVGNLAGSGGAVRGVSYLPFLGELDSKNIVFNSVGMSSAFIVFMVFWLCGYSKEEIVIALKSIKGDQWQKLGRVIASEKAPLWKKILVFPIYQWNLRRSFTKSIFRVLKNYDITWDRMKKAGRCKKPFITVCRSSDVFEVGIKDILGELFLKKQRGNDKIFDMKTSDAAKIAKPYFVSWDGVYTYNYRTDKIEKISSQVNSLKDVFWAGFNNPLLKKAKLKLFSKKKERVIDGGLVCNMANLIFTGKNFHQVCCVDHPKDYDANGGILSVSDYNFQLNIPDLSFNQMEFNHEDFSFFEFTDRLVDIYAKMPNTNVFGEEK